MILEKNTTSLSAFNVFVLTRLEYANYNTTFYQFNMMHLQGLNSRIRYDVLEQVLQKVSNMHFVWGSLLLESLTGLDLSDDSHIWIQTLEITNMPPIWV